MEGTKKNTDYSASAVNLGQHAEVEMAYVSYKDTLADKQGIQNRIDALIEKLLGDNAEYNELTRELGDIENRASQKYTELKNIIDSSGSWQDVENGYYAVKQRKESKSYLAEPFAKHFEKFAPMVIVPSVNTKALEGLIKGKLITEDELDNAGVIQRTESFAYIIK